MRTAAFVFGASVLLAFVGCSAERSAPSVRVADVRALGIEPHDSAAKLELPKRADGEVVIAPPGREISVRIALRGAASVPARDDEGVTVFSGALDGADVAHVPIADGFEDLLFFREAPEREEIVYDLDVTNVAGMRSIGSQLELLDAHGAPRLRVEPPWLVDASGKRVAIDLDVEGCAVDRDPRVTWDRPVVAPGGHSCRLRIAWGGRGVRYPAIVDPQWKLGASGYSRHDHAMIAYANGRLLVASGYHQTNAGMSGNGPADNANMYDPATQTWQVQFIGIPSARQEGALALLPDGRAGFFGGDGPSRVELFASDGSVLRSDMNTAFSFGRGVTATSLANGKVLVAGGSLTGTVKADAQLYDAPPTDTFTPAGTSPAGSLKTARAYHTATRLVSGKVLLAGGILIGGAKTANAEIYDPVADTFTTVPGNMTAARARHTASLLADGTVLIAGGGTAAAEIYDPVANAFTATTSAGVVRTGAEAVVLDSGDVMVAGGDGPLSSVEIFDAKAKTWSAQPSLLFPRQRFKMARLADGSVFVFGGVDGTVSIASPEIWKPGAAGTACTTGDDCRSGACEEGICCAAPCAPSCQTCAPTTGACVTVTNADDASSCTGTNTCDAAGACKKKIGQTCTTNAECATAQCIDGFCCNRACEGQCEACDVPGQLGVCSPVPGAPHGARPACTATGTTCGGTCNGLLGTSCAYPSAITTCGTSCSGADLTTSTCDGAGACLVDAPRACSGNFVCADALVCKTTCTSNADCRKDYQCEPGEGGRCLPIALCEERFVTKGTQRIDCYPYTCEQTGVCRTACASVADCVAPTVCSFDGLCIDPPPPTEASCSMTRARVSTANGAFGIGLALAALGALRRRGRRTRR